MQNTVSDYSETLKSFLTDTGVQQELIELAMQLCQSGQEAELIRFLKLRRCDMVEEMHEYQRKVDRIDYLIRQAKKITERKSES